MHVFTYGSLMFAPVWQRVVQGNYKSVAARLDGYARFAVRGASYPGIIAADGAHVPGLLYLDVSKDDSALLDRFEGAEYARNAVAVQCADGTSCNAETYVYLYPHQLSDAEWEADRFDSARFLRTEA